MSGERLPPITKIAKNVKKLLSLVGWYGTSWLAGVFLRHKRKKGGGGHNGFCWSQCAVIEGTMGKSRLIGSSSTPLLLPVSSVSSPLCPVLPEHFPVQPVSSPVSPVSTPVSTPVSPPRFIAISSPSECGRPHIMIGFY